MPKRSHESPRAVRKLHDLERGNYITLAPPRISRGGLTSIFLAAGYRRRPVQRSYPQLQDDPEFRDLIPFHEYFHGETGAGLGASHQTGWTGLVALLLTDAQSGETSTTALRPSAR
jgi:hypothetical protein